MGDGYLTAKQVGDRAGMHEDTVLRWFRTKRLKGYKIGHRTVRFLWSDVEKAVMRAARRSK